MRENVKEFFVHQKRSKTSKTGKWVDEKWFKSIEELKEYMKWWQDFYSMKDELSETRIVRRVTYDEVVEYE